MSSDSLDWATKMMGKAAKMAAFLCQNAIKSLIV